MVKKSTHKKYIITKKDRKIDAHNLKSKERKKEEVRHNRVVKTIHKKYHITAHDRLMDRENAIMGVGAWHRELHTNRLQKIRTGIYKWGFSGLSPHTKNNENIGKKKVDKMKKTNNKTWDKKNYDFDKLHNNTKGAQWANARLHYKGKKLVKV